MRAVALVAVVATLVDPTNSLLAQSARVAGRAHALSDSTRAVAGAEVTLLPAVRESVADTTGLRRMLTDNNGAFRFAGVADGLYQLRVRRLGFDVRDMDIMVSGQKDRTLDIAMGIAAQQLSSVVVSGRKIEFPVRYAEAYQRMTHEAGNYFTRESIDSAHAIDLKSLLQRLPGVIASDRGIDFQRCQGSVFAPSGNPMQVAQVQVYVDDVRMTRPGNPELDAYHILRDISPSAVQLMEVYPSVARIPGKYLADACAVILVWTK